MEYPTQEPTAPELSFEDQEILRLKAENEIKQEAFNKQREIERLKIQGNRLEMQNKEMHKKFNPKFNFTKEKAKFWAIAIVISITVAIIVVKVAQKLF